MKDICVVYFPFLDPGTGVREVEIVLARGEFRTSKELVLACLRERHRHHHLTASYAAGQFLIGPGHLYNPSKSPYEYPPGRLVGWMGTAAKGSLEVMLRRELAHYFPEECTEDD